MARTRPAPLATARLWVWAFALAFTAASHAYTPIALDPAVGVNGQRHGGEEGVVVRWDLDAYPDGAIPYWVNPAYPSDAAPFAPAEERIAAVQRAFQVWEDVPGCAARFRYMGTTDRRDAFDGVNVVTFDPVFPPPDGFPGGIFPIAWYAEGPGEALTHAGRTLQASFAAQIVDCDLIVAPHGKYVIGGEHPLPWGAFDFEGILVHEIGHMLGLDHTGLDQTTMYAYATHAGGYFEKRPSTDDAFGASVLYPEAGFLEANGTLRGAVTRADGSPQFGAHVVAIDVDSGAAVVSTITGVTAEREDGLPASYGRQSGDFVVVVPPGRYRLLAEPFGRADQGPPWLSGVLGSASGGELLLAADFEPSFPEAVLEVAAGGGAQARAIVVADDAGVSPGFDRRTTWVSVEEGGGWRDPARARPGAECTLLVQEGRGLFRVCEDAGPDAGPEMELELVEGAEARFLTDRIAIESILPPTKKRQLRLRLTIAPDCPPGDHVLMLTTPDGATYYPGALRVLRPDEPA